MNVYIIDENSKRTLKSEGGGTFESIVFQKL
jgi:hypothetical protein